MFMCLAEVSVGTEYGVLYADGFAYMGYGTETEARADVVPGKGMSVIRVTVDKVA